MQKPFWRETQHCKNLSTACPYLFHFMPFQAFYLISFFLSPPHQDWKFDILSCFILATWPVYCNPHYSPIHILLLLSYLSLFSYLSKILSLSSLTLPSPLSYSFPFSFSSSQMFHRGKIFSSYFNIITIFEMYYDGQWRIYFKSCFIVLYLGSYYKFTIFESFKFLIIVILSF